MRATWLYEGDLHAKRVLSLANATLGVLTSASLAVHAIGQGLAQAMGKLSKHGIKQVDRLLSNEAIDVQRFFGHWVAYMVGTRVEIVVALDWTSFARDGHETIVLSMLTGHGRATPLMWRTVQASTLKGNQRRHDEHAASPSLTPHIVGRLSRRFQRETGSFSKFRAIIYHYILENGCSNHLPRS